MSISRTALFLLLAASAVTPALAPLHAQTMPPPDAKAARSGKTATLIRDSVLFVGPSTDSHRIQPVTQGHEVSIIETASNGWIRVFANTDIELNSEEVQVFGVDAKIAPASGWILDKGLIRKGQPNGDVLLFGAGVSAEAIATTGRGQRAAAQQARLLYKRLTEYFPDSPLVGEAMWRSADIRWQLDYADVQSRPSAHEKENYLRGQIDEEEMRKIEKKFPGTKWAALAAWDRIDNKLCGDWQGSVKCPEKEAELYQKYAADYPASPRVPQALYNAAWRLACAGDMLAAEESKSDKDKAVKSRADAQAIAQQLEAKFPQTDYAARAALLVYKVQQSIPIYGSDRD
jgi:hypothetical protein